VTASSGAAASQPPSRRVRAIEALRGRHAGEVVLYSELQDAIGVEDHKGVQSAVNSAKYRLALDYLIAVESVPGVGYRIVPSRERVRLARTDQHRAQQALKRGRRTAIYVDVRDLDSKDRELLERTAQSLALQLDFARRMDVRQESIDAALRTVPNGSKSKGERTRDEIRRLEARLAALNGGEVTPGTADPEEDDEPGPLAQ
jgi:hypothetical protein